MFQSQFGAGVDQLELLIAQNTVTIARLMEIAPAGTIDPTSGLYNSTMILMAMLLALALVSNALMRPVHPNHHLPNARSCALEMGGDFSRFGKAAHVWRTVIHQLGFQPGSRSASGL